MMTLMVMPQIRLKLKVHITEKKKKKQATDSYGLITT